MKIIAMSRKFISSSRSRSLIIATSTLLVVLIATCTALAVHNRQQTIAANKVIVAKAGNSALVSTPSAPATTEPAENEPSTTSPAAPPVTAAPTPTAAPTKPAAPITPTPLPRYTVLPSSITISSDGCYVTATGTPGQHVALNVYQGQHGGAPTYVLPLAGTLTVSTGGQPDDTVEAQLLDITPGNVDGILASSTGTATTNCGPASAGALN